MKNPFFLREISLKDPFCDREAELEKLCQHGQSLANIVLYSPRRFGKTSLVKRVQAELAAKGAITVYCQFYGVTSEEDVASRLAKAILQVTQAHESLFQKALRYITAFRLVMTMEPDAESGLFWTVQLAKSHLSGYELLEDVMQSLSHFIENAGVLVHIVLDEFQEITLLPKPKKIEALLREYIQKQKAAYLFVGSRRSLLLSMFNERSRAFYGSAINFPLGPLPSKEFIAFIQKGFADQGKSCEESAAEKIVSLVEGYPYYGQKLAYLVFDISEKTTTINEVLLAFNSLLKEETPVFESILMGLSPQQIALLKALAKESTNSIFSQEFLQRHRLGSLGGIQGSAKKLSLLDLIERTPSKVWRLVDPLFAKWLILN